VSFKKLLVGISCISILLISIPFLLVSHHLFPMVTTATGCVYCEVCPKAKEKLNFRQYVLCQIWAQVRNGWASSMLYY